MKQILIILIVAISFTFCRKRNPDTTACSNPYSTMLDTIFLTTYDNIFSYIDGFTYVLQTDNWNNAFYYTWSTGDTTSAITVTASGDYIVYAHFSNWQVYDSSTFYIGTLIENIQVPNSFTPNGDGINDIFSPVVSNICFESYSLFIYNKHNSLVFESHNPTIGWDGNYKTTALTIGYYTFQIQATNYNNEVIQKEGSINLLR